MKKAPKIEPIQVKEYTVKQSDYEVVGKLPIRSVILGPSGSGKTVILQNMILNIYKGCFSRIYIFSPSIDVDTANFSHKNSGFPREPLRILRAPLLQQLFSAVDKMIVGNQPLRILNLLAGL